MTTRIRAWATATAPRDLASPPRPGFSIRITRCHPLRSRLVSWAERRRTMRVFVAGAGGAVGNRLVPQLVARGHQVFGTTQSRDALEEIRALGAEPVVMDGLDAASVGEAVARAEPEAIIHEMTAISLAADFK